MNSKNGDKEPNSWATQQKIRLRNSPRRQEGGKDGACEETRTGRGEHWKGHYSCVTGGLAAGRETGGERVSNEIITEKPQI